MEKLVIFGDSYRGKRVWISGHTGFKGSWLTTLLLELGAEVHGFSLPPPGEPSLFDQIGLQKQIHHTAGDVTDSEAVRKSIEAVQPDFVFHLAAQSLVRKSYEIPLETYATNIMGTATVLDALRKLNRPCGAVFVTTDKCYENREWHYGYREMDRLGGHDPYSSSKAGAELAIQSWRSSFFGKDHPVKIASARAGNVIGGGDWGENRIVPDCVRALSRKEKIVVRNRYATRPWQHVLEPLSGYCWLAAILRNPEMKLKEAEQCASAFNFGPGENSIQSVENLVTEILRHWPGEWEDANPSAAPHEANLLHLVTDKARRLLGWKPVWDFARTISETSRWYRRNFDHPEASRELCLTQIQDYFHDARELNIEWTQAHALGA